MRPFTPISTPKDFDPRLVKILKDLNGYLDQVDKGFSAIARGATPAGGGGGGILGTALTDHHLLKNLNTHDDHPRYAQLDGRLDGQTLYGIPYDGNNATGIWTNAGNFTSKNSKVAAATWSSIAIDTSAAVGDIIILALATLPFTVDANAPSANHTSVTDSKSNTWTKLREHQYANASNGGCYSIWVCTVTTALTAGVDTLTAAYVSSIGAMAITSHRFYGAGGSAVLSGITALGEQGFTGAEPSAQTLSGLVSGQHLFIRFCLEGASGSNVIGPLTKDTDYTEFDDGTSFTSGGSGNVGSFAEYRILAGTGDTTNPSMGISGGAFVSIYVSLDLVPALTGSLTLASSPLITAARITASGSILTLYGRDIAFRDVTGSADLSTIRATTDGAFTGPLNYLGSATGGTTTDLVIPGRLLLGDALSGVNFTTGRPLDIRSQPLTTNLTSVNIAISGSAIATASGTYTGLQLALTGTPTASSGSFTSRGFFFTNSMGVPSGVTMSDLVGGVFQTTTGNNSGTLTSSTGLRIINLGATTGAGTGTNLHGLEIRLNSRNQILTNVVPITLEMGAGSLAAAVTNFIGIEYSGSLYASAVVVNWTGLSIPTITGPGTVWALDLGVNNSRIAGKLRLGGTTTPTNPLSITGAADISGIFDFAAAPRLANDIWLTALNSVAATVNLIRYSAGNNTEISSGNNIILTAGGAGAMVLRSSASSPVKTLDLSAMTGELVLRAGTTGAPPIRFLSGTSITSPIAGSIEFTTDDLFLTITTGTARKAFVLDDGTRLTSGRIPFATTNGRLIDDADLTFATDTLTVTKIAATTLTGLLTLTDAIDIALGSSTGTKIGTAATHKLGFWNAAPIVQPATGGAAATFTANTSGIVDDSATFDGYTLGQIVKALRNAGLLA